MDLAKHVRPLAGETDWPLWKRKIRDMLDYHEGALDVIDRRLIKPEPPTEVSDEDGNSSVHEGALKTYTKQRDLYRKANSYAKSMISSAVTDAVYQKIMDKESAADAWDALKKLFEASSKDQLFKICTDFFAFSWTQDVDVSTHTAKLLSLFTELNNGLRIKKENQLPEMLLVCKVLQILPASYKNFRSSWMLLSKDSERGFEALVTKLCMFERNFKGLPEAEKPEALHSRGTPNPKKRKPGICNYCKKKGHWVRDCRKWIADGKPSKSVNELENGDMALAITSDEVHEVAAGDSDRWWVDNGATQHVTHCADISGTSSRWTARVAAHTNNKM